MLDQLSRLRDRHMRQLFRRDIPELDEHCAWHTFDPNPIGWLLAHQYDGDTTRTIRVRRRVQALCLYAGIPDTLREPAITEAIDAGDELVPLLMKRLSLTRGQLGSLRQATPSETIASYRRHSFENAVLRLRAHTVPLHQWPGGGKPAQHAAWRSSPWLTADRLTLVPADYYGADPATVRDAVRAFTDDLLTPLLNEFKSPVNPSDISPSGILGAINLQTLPAIQHYLASVRHALIGPRGPKAFQEAAHLWHRRAAAVAALRNESQTDRPGWPPLCPPWTSPCGQYQIVPLTGARALVEKAMRTSTASAPITTSAAPAARRSCPCARMASLPSPPRSFSTRA
jgi:hypothetical protein